MKKIMNRIACVIRIIFGYGIMVCLLVGGLTFFGYIVALFIGDNTAEFICRLIYKHIYPILVVLSTSMIVLGLIWMYIVGESTFSGKTKQTKQDSKETC